MSTSVSTLVISHWNSLADGLAQTGGFLDVDPEFLEWEYRKPLILREIDRIQSDIFCIVEANNYDTFWEPEMEKRGYLGVHFPKPVSTAVSLGYTADGPAMFVRKSRFLPIYVQKLQYDGHNQNAIIQLLSDNETNSLICVVSTHLKANTGDLNESKRISQICQLCKHIARFDETIPVILTGDLNDRPNSDVYNTCVSHMFKSVFDEDDLHTTWKQRETGVKKEIIDYIWYKNMNVIFKDPLYNDGHKLPNTNYPSDHVMLSCTLEYV